MNCAQSNTQMIYTRIQQDILNALRQNNRASLSACLNTMSRRECKTLLNEFIPIHEKKKNVFETEEPRHICLVIVYICSIVLHNPYRGTMFPTRRSSIGTLPI